MYILKKVGYYGRKDGYGDWRESVDIAMPMYNDFHKRNLKSLEQYISDGVLPTGLSEGDDDQRRALYFSGNFGNGEYECDGITLKSCSAGVRPWLQEFISRPSIRDHVAPPAPGTTTTGRLKLWSMEDGWLAPCPSGAGCWSLRLYDALTTLTIPIILSDGAVLPFERYLSWSDISYRVQANDLIPSNCFEEEEKGLVEDHGFGCRSKQIKAESFIYKLIAETKEVVKYCVSSSSSSSSSSLAAISSSSCQSLNMVKMMQNIDKVRSYFSYDPSTPRSAWGLFLLELSDRKKEEKEKAAWWGYSAKQK
jgi:hypothetical protein